MCLSQNIICDCDKAHVITNTYIMQLRLSKWLGEGVTVGDTGIGYSLPSWNVSNDLDVLVGRGNLIFHFLWLHLIANVLLGTYSNAVNTRA